MEFYLRATWYRAQEKGDIIWLSFVRTTNLHNFSNEKLLVEVNMLRKCIDVTARSIDTGTTSTVVNFSLSRAVLECIETLVRDYFRLQLRTFVPCIILHRSSLACCGLTRIGIHCIMLNNTPESSPPVYISYPYVNLQHVV